MRMYTLDERLLEDFEIGALLLAILAWPGPAEERQQREAAEALCALALLKTSQADPRLGAKWREMRPEYAKLDEREIRRRLRTFERRRRHRMIAARMVLGHLEEAITGRPAKLPPQMARLSLNELSKLVQAQSRLSDPEMVERRIWRASRPVIHLAAAFQVAGRTAGGIDGFSYDWNTGPHDLIVELAGHYERVVLADTRLGVRPDELIRLRYVPLARAA